MEKTPQVSVLMSVYNGEEQLAASLKSILQQTLEDLELIVVDDGSTDDSAALLATCDDPRLRVITQANHGLTVSLNRAAGAARGKYLARMDVGDYSQSRRLEQQVRFLDAHPEVAACGTRTAWTDAAGEVIGTSQVITAPAALRRGLLKANLLSHGSALIRREAFNAVGGYREFFRYAQDYDFWLRLSERYDLSNLEEVLYHWQVAPGSISAAHYALQQAYRRLAMESAVARRSGRPDPIQPDTQPPVIDSLQPGEAQAMYHAMLARGSIMGGDYRRARRCLRESLTHRFRSGSYALLWFSRLPGFVIRAILKLRLCWLNRKGAPLAREEEPHQ